MATTFEDIDELGLKSYLNCEGIDCDLLKDVILDTLKDATMPLTLNMNECVLSFAYVAIQKFISHCKDNDLDPFSMSFEEINEFVDKKLKTEL